MSEFIANEVTADARAGASGQGIRIFAATHRRAAAFESSIIDQVQVGSARAAQRFENTLHDDEGDNISELNPYYCELTSQYWAWKNVDAEYYGFCHYRRYFDFSEVEHEENPWGEVLANVLDGRAQREFGLDDASIRAAVEGWDVVTTRNQDLRGFPEYFSTPYEHWHVAKSLRDEDLDDMLAILIERRPDYLPDIESYLRGNFSRFCNMFIMRKPVFYNYCEWLFPLLDAFMQQWDRSKCSHETLRTPGHLSERLLNIYLMHQERIGTGLKVKEVQCVHFQNADDLVLPNEVSAVAAGGRPIVPVVLAADNNYVPMLATTAYSMLKNASPGYHYHVVVLTTDITADNQRLIRNLLEPVAPCTLDFLDVRRIVGQYDLTTSNQHISTETYYRFLIQDVLPYYDKVLYLDSDLIIEGDVSELFAVDLQDNCLGAVIDVDYLGNLNIDSKRMEYTKDVLGMKDPYAYFQAGVLVMNTHELRKVASVADWLEIAQNPEFIYNDQDILNKYCEGRVLYVDPAWNVMIDGCNRIQVACSHAPADVFDAYREARKHEKIIHYAGADKPWSARACDRADHYWKYARETPFYEQLLLLGGAYVAKSDFRQMMTTAVKGRLMSYVGKIAPPKSPQRAVLKSIHGKLNR